MDPMIKDGWFREPIKTWWPGQAFSLEVEEVLYHQKSKFQDILVFQSKSYGRVLVLDGIIQVTERDEFSYHEMIAHIPLFSHPNPKSVLVVGGGDGGVLREVAKHPTVEEIHICEIDEDVIEVCKKYLPFTAVGFSNPKVKVHIDDGAKFLTAHQSSFDVIITDSSDPLGPNTSLFLQPYYEKLRGALRPGGIICNEGDCLWLDLAEIKSFLEAPKSLFPVTGYGFTTIPTYPGGQVGFIMASLNKDTVFWEPPRSLSEGDTEKLNLRYYNNEVHKAAFVLPQYAKKELELAVNPS